jgi:hypothetical protein
MLFVLITHPFLDGYFLYFDLIYFCFKLLHFKLDLIGFLSHLFLLSVLHLELIKFLIHFLHLLFVLIVEFAFLFGRINFL